MNKSRLMRTLIAATLAASCSVWAADAPAGKTDEATPAPYGPGMMGRGMMGPGQGPCGMGRGMMGPGMMGGGWGMGPGMMGGGWGMGPGMMGGGWGMGPMRGYGMGPLWDLDLTPDQQARIAKIRDETRRKRWDLMGAYQDEMARLRELYGAPTRDTAAIDKAYKHMSGLRQQMFDLSREANDRIEGVLTKDQDQKLRSYWRRGWMQDD